MFQAARTSVLLAACLILAACGRAPVGGAGDAQADATSEPGYTAPPTPTELQASASSVTLSGTAAAGAPIRLATPGGEAQTTTADDQGRWRLQLAASPDVRIFGLSTRNVGQAVQAEGYVLVGPKGQGALLRAGAAALRLDRRTRPGLASIDFDADGGALVTGWAAAGTDVALRLDGKPAGAARADGDGRFSLSLPRLGPGAHRVEAAGVGFNDALAFDATKPEPLANGPLRSQLTGQGLRADWLTPGGGVQTTILTG